MKKWKKIALKSMLGLSLTLTSIYFFAPWEFALYYLSERPSTVEEQVKEATSQNIDGIIVYLQQGTRPPEGYASGWHDRQKQIPAYPNALFKIASIGKLYDASAVAKLVAAGRLDLNKTLAEYLPELIGKIEYADQISLRMLVEHRSGIPNFTDQENFDWANSSLNMLDLVVNKPADFLPGTDYAYSNTNYLLLQNIMTATLGYDYTQFIKREMLDPMGLKHTYFSVHEVDPNDLMSGYYVGYDDDFKSLDQGYVASAEDVGRFLRALNDGSLFDEEEAKIYRSLYEYEHTGWVLGYSSIARYHPDIDAVIIQFTNTTGNDTVILTNIIYQRIVEILHERDQVPTN